MSTAAGISLEDYLSTHYEPECELIDGELHRKPMGTADHSRTQHLLEIALHRFETDAEIRVAPEVSIRNGNDVRIPDVTVYRADTRLYRGILYDPPILCIEIVSPSQHPSELFAKCETYHTWGVPYCWVVDPIKQTAWEYHASAPLDRVTSSLHAGIFEVVLDEIFERQ